jgi:hypothetical protein
LVGTFADCCRHRNQAVVVRRYVEDLAFAIDGTPQIHPLAGDATTISSRCHRQLGRGRRSRSRRATTGPNFSTQRRTVHEIRHYGHRLVAILDGHG